MGGRFIVAFLAVPREFWVAPVPILNGIVITTISEDAFEVSRYQELRRYISITGTTYVNEALESGQSGTCLGGFRSSPE